MTTLQSYFISLQKGHLSQQDKASIYKDFLKKRERKANNRRTIVYKSFAYSLSTLTVVWFLLFGNFFGVFKQEWVQLTQTVEAQAIGKIITSKWIFSIYNKENRKIDTNIITLTDRIIVEKDANIKILINDSFTAEIIGPAQFEIIIDEDQDNKNYNLKFINWGDFVAIDSVAHTENNNIKIETSDGVTIQQSKENKTNNTTSFEIKETKGNKTIINKSANTIEVTKTDNINSLFSKITSPTTPQEKVIIKAEQIVEIQKNNTNDNTIKIISQQDTTIPNENKSNINKKTEQKPNSIIEEEQKPIFTTQDNTEISSNLYKSFLQKEYNELLLYHFWGELYKKNIVLNNINNRLNRIATIAQFKTNTQITLPEIITFAQELYTYCQKTNISKRSYRNLPTLINKLVEINKHDFWIIPQAERTNEEQIKHIYGIINLQQDQITYTFD